VGVNTVALLRSASATCLARPLSAGPTGLFEFAGVSPGEREMRVVFGVQFVAPRQVSRRNTWRKPLLGEAAGLAGNFPLAASWLGVTARNYDVAPEELIEGNMLSMPFSAPPGSVETSDVAPCRSTCSCTGVPQIHLAPEGAPSRRFVAAELNAMYRPSALITGVWLSALPGALSAATEIIFVLGVHPFCTPRAGIPQHDLCGLVFLLRTPRSVHPGFSAGVSSRHPLRPLRHR